MSEEMKALLLRVGDSIKTGWELCDSKWQKSESEWLACQTLSACAKNLRDHGEAISWLMPGAERGRMICGADNAAGLEKLFKDGSMIKESYTGTLEAPEGVSRDDSGKPYVLRCTDSIIYYAASKIFAKEAA